MRAFEDIILESIYSDILFEDIENKIPILLKQYSNLSEDIIRSFAEIDPSGNKGAYANWLARLTSRGNIKLPEDASKVKEALSIFEIQKKAPNFSGSKDINSYNSYGDLAETLEANKGKASKGESKRQQISKGTDVVFEDNKFKVFKITTKESAAKMCRETKWCIKDPKYSKFYLDLGPFFMIAKKDNNGLEPYVLMHFESGSIKDIFDRSINESIANEISYIVKKFPQFQAMSRREVSPEVISEIRDVLDPVVVMEFLDDSPAAIFPDNIEDAKTTTIYDLVKNIYSDFIDVHMETIELEDAIVDSIYLNDFAAFLADGRNLKDELIDQGISEFLDYVQSVRWG